MSAALALTVGVNLEGAVFMPDAKAEQRKP